MMQRFALRFLQSAIDMAVLATGHLEGRPLPSWFTRSTPAEEVRAVPSPWVTV